MFNYPFPGSRQIHNPVEYNNYVLKYLYRTP